MNSGGDKGPGEARAEYCVLLPNRKRCFVLCGVVQSDVDTRDCGPGSGPGRPGTTHFQPHLGAEEEDGPADTDSR